MVVGEGLQRVQKWRFCQRKTAIYDLKTASDSFDWLAQEKNHGVMADDVCREQGSPNREPPGKQIERHICPKQHNRTSQPTRPNKRSCGLHCNNHVVFIVRMIIVIDIWTRILFHLDPSDTSCLGDDSTTMLQWM